MNVTLDSRTIELQQLREAYSDETSVDMRKNNESLIAATMRGYDNLDSPVQLEFEDAFKKIKVTTGITEVDGLVRTFIKCKEHNFSLFNNVNEQNSEIEKYEEQIQQLKEEDLKFSQESGMAKKYEQRCQDLQRITKSIDRGMQNIFSNFDFAEEEGAPPPVVTEVNMVHNLGLIDQKTNQLLQHYSQVHGLLQGPSSTKASTQGRTPLSGGRNDRAAVDEEDGFDELQDMAQNLVSVLGTGPKVPMSQELPNANQSKFEDYRSDDSDNEDNGDTQPRTREKLKHRALNKLQKRLGLGGMAMLSLTGGCASGITNSSALDNPCSNSSTAVNAGATSGGDGGGCENRALNEITSGVWMFYKFIESILLFVSVSCFGYDSISRMEPQGCRCFRANWRTFPIGLLLLIARVVDGAAATLPQSEYLALYDLYNSTNGADWRWSNLPQDGIPWVFSADANPCADHWQGVDCIVVNAPPLHTYHVSSLILSHKRLRGPLPNSLDDLPYLEELYLNHNHLTGSIPNSIGNLTNLQYLGLLHNQLNGSIPSSIGNLTNLMQLYLFHNQLTGSIPSSIGNLRILQYLYLDTNHLTGSIPSSIGNLTNLQQLDLNINRLTGPIPSSICNLTSLQYLDLYVNELTGSIPSSIGRLANLLDFNIDLNQLTGSIPSSIGNLTNLQFLYLHHNQLTGSIPSTFEKLTNLLQLDLKNNQLNGSIPTSIDNLSNLQYLVLNNNQLTGSISSSIGNLTNLQYLYFFNNHLTGSIPSSIGNLMDLQKLFLDYNQLTGSIPSSISNPTNLSYLSLSNNHITGSAPSSFGNLTNLQYLDLSDNQMTGQLGQFGHMRFLVSISLQGNRFTGPIADVFSSAQTQLQAAQLDGNQFTGTLPAVLFDLPSLVSFSMVGSCLHGTLPGNICNATQLEALILYGLTTGASCRARGVQLQSRQSFAGIMPSCLLQLPALRTLLLSSNGLSGSVGIDILGSHLLQLDLSHNDLTGSIPNSLQNRSWALLDLSHNKLSGTLHADLLRPLNTTLLSNFTTDSSVFLTSNRLSGPVPSSLRPLQSNLSVLAGNLFECKYDKSNLPQHDSDISNYQCASNDFNAAIYAWLCLYVGTAVVLLIVYRRNLSLIMKPALIQLPDEHSARLTHLHSLLEEYHVLSKAAWCCAAFCLVVLLPYYAVVSHYEGTHTYQYAYVLSAIYTSGVLPFVLVVLLLGLLIAVVYSNCVVKYTMVVVAASDTGEYSDDRWRYASVVTMYSLANVIVVLGANVAFVYVVLYQSSQLQTLAQVLLSLFKLGWSVAASPYLIRQLDMYFYPEERGPAQSYFALQLLVALFNNIAIPCLVVAAIDPNCFSNILLPPDSQTVAYLLPTCRNVIFAFQTCERITPELATLQFTPPFTYSYQCSASFITSYAPTFIYMSISTVFLSPLLQYVLLRLHERLPAGSIAHRMVSKVLPRMLKPPVTDVTSLDRRKSPILRAVGTLVTLLTQLGILLTFGAIFPPVALAMAVSITAVVMLTRYKVHRFMHAVVEKQLFPYLDIINAECERVGTSAQMQVAVKILICYCCAFYTLFLFDTLGDAVGFDASVWVLVVFPLLPLAVHGAESLWRNCFQEVVMVDRKNEEPQQEPAAADIDIELPTPASGHDATEGGSAFASLSKGGSEDKFGKDHTVNILHTSNV